MAKKIKQAIVLAGGKGERLRPLTNNHPKPMVEVAGKPIIEYPLLALQNIGVEEVVFACSYLHEVIEKYIGDGKKYGICAKYSIEETPLGRGGGIKSAMKLLDEGWEDAFVLNGDQIWELDLEEFARRHQEKKAIATVAVVPLKSPYGIVEFNKRKQVLGFREKPLLPHWINAGVYIFNKEIESMLPEVGDHETETFPILPQERFHVFESTSYWRGIDTVKDLTEASKEVVEIFNS